MSRPRHCRTRPRHPQGRHAEHRHRRRPLRRRRARAGRRPRRAAARRRPPARSPAWPRCCTPTARAWRSNWPRTSPRRCWRIAKDYSHLLFPATAHGKNVAPRVAALLDVAQISDVTQGRRADTFERPIYAGNAIATVQSERPDQGASPCAPPGSTPAAPAAAAPTIAERRRRRPTAARAASSARRSSSSTGPS